MKLKQKRILISFILLVNLFSIFNINISFSPNQEIHSTNQHEQLNIEDFTSSVSIYKAYDYNPKGSGTESDPYIIENSELEGLGDGIGIKFYSSNDYVIVRDCKLSNFSAGISVRDSSKITLKNNEISSCTHYAIDVEESNHIIIEDNYCHDNEDDGLYFEDSSYCRIHENTIENNEAIGLIFNENCDHNLITDNTVSNAMEGFTIRTSSYNNFTGNSISDCSQYGIYMSDSKYNKLTGNTIEDCDDLGIGLFNCNNIEITDNILKSASIYENGQCEDNTIANNKQGGRIDIEAGSIEGFDLTIILTGTIVISTVIMLKRRKRVKYQ